MNVKQILPMLLILAFFAPSVLGATGDVDLLCSSISDDLNVAGGCVDDDGLEDAVTSATGLFVLEGGDSSSLAWLAIIGIIGIAVVGSAIGLYVRGMGAVKKS